MFNIAQFREHLVVPALSKLHMYSKDAEELLVFTCAAESNGGTYLHQIKGPALGIYQCEPATHHDIWQNYLRHRGNLVQILALNFGVNYDGNTADRLIYDLHYATAICRLDYRREPEPLPNKDDVEGMWEYYKKYYNSSKGKAKKDRAIKAYESFSKS